MGDARREGPGAAARRTRPGPGRPPAGKVQESGAGAVGPELPLLLVVAGARRRIGEIVVRGPEREGERAERAVKEN